MKRKAGKSIVRVVLTSIVVVGCFIITVTIGGCGWMKKILPESAKDKALEYLNTKYSAHGDTFTPVSFTPSDWSDPDATVTFKSQKYNDQIVTVFIHSDKENSYSDDYYQLCMADEVEQYFVNVAKEHGINAKASITFSSTGAYDENVDAKWTFEDYVNEGLGNMYCYYVLTEDVKDSQAQEIVEDIANRGIYGLVFMYLCSSEKDVQIIVENDDFSSEKLTLLHKWRVRDDGTIDNKR